MVIGDKIRNLRSLKGLPQENMADALKMSLVAYGDIERNKKDISLNRLDQIAKVLSVTVADILAFSDRVSNFFDQCSNAVGVNNGGQTIHNDTKEIQHKLDISQLELEKLKVEKEKSDLEAKYWREKFESK
jgi:XRE family transcriptional regulator, regulator of sulfur utilization